jgi:hypothetical protein
MWTVGYTGRPARQAMPRNSRPTASRLARGEQLAERATVSHPVRNLVRPVGCTRGSQPFTDGRGAVVVAGLQRCGHTPEPHVRWPESQPVGVALPSALGSSAASPSAASAP